MSNIVKLTLEQSENFKEFIGYASYETEPYTSGKAIAINVDVAKQELDSLFSTRKYERPYLPEYYNPLEEVLGDLWTAESNSLALQSIITKVNQFIPRLQVSTNTSFTYNDHKLEMSLIFSFKNDFSKALYNYTRRFDIIM